MSIEIGTSVEAATFADVIAALPDDEYGLTFAGDRRLGYAEIRDRTADLAARWSGLGVGPGDRVLFVVADDQEFVLAFFAALRAGVVPVPVYPPFLMGQLDHYRRTLRGIEHSSGAVLCLTSTVLTGMLEEIGLDAPVVDLAALEAAGPSGPPVPPGPADVAFLQYTSGSTGDPKGVVVTHGSLLHNARAIAATLQVDRTKDRGVSWLPLYHDMGLIGMLLVPVLTRSSVWYLPPLAFARDPMIWLREISRVHATVSFAPNFAFEYCVRRASDEVVAELDLSAWRVAGCGAEPIRPETLDRFSDRFAAAGFRATTPVPCYGLAEATLAVTMTPMGRGPLTRSLPGADGKPATLVSCGPPLAGVEVRVVHPEHGTPLAEGQEGEICVRSESVAAGYFRDPQRTAGTFRDGWLHTGDQGVLAGGELYVTGRIKDLIIVNGRNYQPQDIEWLVGGLPGVRRGNVVAVSGRGETGEQVRVVAETAAGAEPGPLTRAIRREVRSALGLTVGDVVLLPREALPKTSSGKLRRQYTRTLLEDGTFTPVPGT